MTIERATRRQAKGRMLLFGPSGSGKTVSALRIAQGIGGKILLIDTENRSSEKYADLIIEEGCEPFVFDILPLSAPYSPQRYIEALHEGVQGGYDVCVMDSITHEWDGTGGVKEIVDAAKSKFGGHAQGAWSVGTPLHNKFLEAILRTPFHVVATARSKTEWVEGEDARGRKVFNKVGLNAVQRDTIEYEFDVTMLLDSDNAARVVKTRAKPHFPPQQMFSPITEATGSLFLEWLSEGASPAATESIPAPVEAAKPEAMSDGDRKELVDAATERIHDLQKDFGDYAEGLNWVDQMHIKIGEWWGVTEIDALDGEQLRTLISRLDASRTKKDQELQGATV